MKCDEGSQIIFCYNLYLLLGASKEFDS
jgi:hypothetical protein